MMDRKRVVQSLLKLAKDLIRESAGKKITKATVKSVLRKIGLKEDQYELDRDTVTFWPEFLDEDHHEGIKEAEKMAKKFAKEFTKKTGVPMEIATNHSKYWIKWTGGSTLPKGDWNDPSSEWHY